MPERCDCSVVVPMYNSVTYVAATLDTVLAQTLLPQRIVVVDDGSTDDSVRFVREYALRNPLVSIVVHEQSHRGPGAARNLAVRRAQTRWVAFLDADDRWYSTKLEVVFREIASKPEYNFLCHHEIVRFTNGRQELTYGGAPIQVERNLKRQLLRENIFSTSAIVCERASVLAVGGFDESLSSAQDYELWIRMAPRVQATYIHEALGEYVMREGNISSTKLFRRYRNLALVMARHHEAVSAIEFARLFVARTARHFLSPAVRAVIRSV